MNTIKTSSTILFLLLFILSCTPKLEKWYFNLSPEVPQSYESIPKKKKRSKHYKMCKNQLNNAPDTNHVDQSTTQIVRVNVHWMNSADTLHSFDEGIPFEEKRAIWYTKKMIHFCNLNLKNNNKLFLPYRSDIPVYPINIQLQLTPIPNKAKDKGIYFHYDEHLDYYVHKGKNRNLYTRDVFNKYAVQLDTVINIFILPHHPDSVASSTYNVNRTGIALRNCVKVAGIYEQKVKPVSYRGVIIHELGHLLGLSHAWSRDGCDDTFEHKRTCLSKTSGPGCDTMVSNNIMGYNRFKNALSPEQIGRMHKNFSNTKSKQRNYLVPQWCEFNEEKSIYIRDSINWQCNKDLQGHLVIENGGSLRIFCRLSMPPGAKIIVQPGGKLILDNCRLHNDCDEKWQGIEIQKMGKLAGEVEIIGEVEIEDLVEKSAIDN